MKEMMTGKGLPPPSPNQWSNTHPHTYIHIHTHTHTRLTNDACDERCWILRCSWDRNFPPAKWAQFGSGLGFWTGAAWLPRASWKYSDLACSRFPGVPLPWWGRHTAAGYRQCRPIRVLMKTEKKNEWIMAEWTNKWMRKWMNEWMNEWMVSQQQQMDG